MAFLININGTLQKSEEKVFLHKNRSFCYGDGLFETIKIVNGKALFLNFHHNRLCAGLKVLNIKPDKLKPISDFNAEIEKTISANNINKGGRLRLSVFRNEGGFYKPETNSSSFIIEVAVLEQNGFASGIKTEIQIYDAIRKPVNVLSNLKNPYALISVMAAQTAQNNTESILLNAYGNICESSSSNIFIVKKEKLFTPHLNQACVDGVMRRFVINNIAPKLKLEVEEGIINPTLLTEADEIFLTNTIQGVKPVNNFGENVYKIHLSRKISDFLNESLYKRERE